MTGGRVQSHERLAEVVIGPQFIRKQGVNTNYIYIALLRVLF